MRIPKLTFVYDRKGYGSKDKPAPVELRIGSGKNRKYVSSGVKLYPKEWSNGSVVGRKDFKELNSQLQILQRKCSEIIIDMMDEGKLDIDAVPRLLHERMVQQKTFLDYAKEHAEKIYKGISPGTIEHYKLFFRFMDRWKGIIYFADVTENNITKMDDELKSRGLKVCSRWNYHKMLQTFILQAVKDGQVDTNPYDRLNIKKGGSDGLTRLLTPEEFHRFEECEIADKVLERVRDLFIFQTYTCMGYSDLASFKYKDCTEVNGQAVYKGHRTKTGQEYTIVLMKPAIAILEKYKGRLPIISNVKYNLYLKAAVKYAKIDKQVTTHWARHTGATMLLNEGKIPMHIVQHILGHATIRETERTYAKVLDRTIVEAMANYENKKF